MNHKFLSYLTPAFMAIAMGLGFAACSEDAFDSGSEGEGQITITLSSSKVASRAETPGEDRLNENLIGKTRLYFYPESSSDTDQPIFEHHVDPNKTSSATVTLLMKQAKELFGENGTKCKVYALTNLPDWSKITSDLSRQALRNVAITSPFEISKEQTSFVMDGEGTITLDRDNQTAKGSVSLVRSAAKIILSLRVASEIKENENTENQIIWHSNRANMFVSFANGVKTSIVDKKTDDTFTTPPSEDMFSIPISTLSGRTFTNTGATANDAYPFVQTLPFYTYPNKCTDASNADANHPYLTLMVQWQNQTVAGAEAQYCYYQIPIGKHGNMKLDRNNIYRINLNVSKLGSFIPTEAVELDMSYEVVNWSTAATEVEIEDYRYLVLNQTEYIMNNENEITIPFYSSHDVELANVTLKYSRYNEPETDGKETVFTVTEAENIASRTDKTDPRSGIYYAKPNNDNKTLTFYHDLKKIWSKNDNGVYVPTNEDAYSPYTIELTFHHTDKESTDKNYAKTVKIIQYPAMYIQVENSPSREYIFINDNNTKERTDKNDKWGRRYLGMATTDDGNYNLGNRTSNPSNKNYNNYTITITKLNDNKYVIADPRQNIVNNNLENLFFNNAVVKDDSQVALWSVAAPSLTDLTGVENADYIYNQNKTQRLLSYYYPTDENPQKANYVAPKITVASSRGATGELTKIGARRRCASYQENGRPAGRWRLPTPGEIEFIMNISISGKIPFLFGNKSGSSDYWTSYGYVTVNNEENTFSKEEGTKGRKRIRCVYDEWYWKDKCTQKPFTWGDRPYSDPEVDNSINP